MFFKGFHGTSKEAWASLSRGGMMPVIAATTIAVSIFVLGVFLLIFFNLNNVLQGLHGKLDVMVYLDPTVDKVMVDTVNLRISRVEKIKRYEFISKEEAWQQMQESYNKLSLSDVLEKNPLPDAFKVEVKELSDIKLVAEVIKQFEGVEDVRYGGEIAERIELFTRFISLAGIIIIFLLVTATIMIIVNTIRLTVMARENEINIMSLVGATKSFIKRPFILEGFYLGLAGSLLALSVLKGIYGLAVINIERKLPFLPITLSSSEVNLVFLIVFIIGILLGVIGGYVSVSGALRSDKKN